MQDTTMPAAEAVAVEGEQELASYELAFHVLPTVAEGEVTSVVDALKKKITKAKGEVIDEEAPQRFDLAYEIVKHLEGKNRAFKSAYFGWIRFRLNPAHLETVAGGVEEEKSLLRHLIIRLTKIEEENPFRFHEALVVEKVKTIGGEEDGDDDDSEETEEVEDIEVEVEDSVDAVEVEESTPASIDEATLDEALKKDEA